MGEEVEPRRGEGAEQAGEAKEVAEVALAAEAVGGS